MDSLELKIFKVPESFQKKLTYKTRDSIIRNYFDKEPNFIEDKFFFADQDLKRYGKEIYIDSKLKNWTEFKDY